ncbi:hypothetical protein G9A89_022003 [Geosiphon pyriformis]|nr:hypothetical protein G9A89_022003 [Geosiphon pyriformis]
MHLLHNFLTTTLSHLSFYGIKTFVQVQSKSKLSSIINFVNAPDILEQLFIHWSLDLQVASWSPVYLLCCSIRLWINPRDNFLAGIKWLDLRGPVPAWFDLAVHFLGAHLLAADVRLCISVDHPVNSIVTSTISEAKTILLNSGLVSFNVFTDSFVKHFGFCSVVVRAAVFFQKFGLGVGMKVQGVMLFTLVELKAIALALVCVSLGSSVFIYSDSQAALSACEDKLLLAHPDFRKKLWIEHRQILKIKDHSGILGNKCADEIALDACWCNALFSTYMIWCYLATFDITLGTFLEHYIEQIGKMSLDSKSKTFTVWHPDSHMASGYTSCQSVALRLYFIKLLHGCLPVAVHKRVYYNFYPNVKCLFCSMVDTSDYSFMCSSNMLAHNEILSEFCALNALGCSVVAGVMVIDFVKNLVSSHRSVIWFADGNMSYLVDDIRDRLSIGVVRLLSIDETKGVYSGLYTSYQIFLGMGGMISVVANL